MRHKKIINRKQVWAKRMLVVTSVAGTAVLLVSCGVLYYWITHFHPELYVSPLPLTASAREIQIDDKTIIAKMLREQKIEYTDIVLTPDSFFVIKLEDKSEVWLSSEKELSEQLASLQVILTRLTMEGKRFKKLDLRFDKPVVTL